MCKRNKLKIFYTILTFLIFAPGIFGFSQTRKLSIQFDMPPGFKEVFKDPEINLYGNSSVPKTCRISDTILFDSIKDNSASLYIIAVWNFMGYEKEFRLSVDTDSLLKDTITRMRITFPKDCSFNRHAINKTCPKCKKGDKVFSIFYGLPVFDEKGNVPGRPPEKYQPGGCMVSDCDPTWYCQRDKLEF